jgi:hypothetical protein
MYNYELLLFDIVVYFVPLTATITASLSLATQETDMAQIIIKTTNIYLFFVQVLKNIIIVSYTIIILSNNYIK